MKGRVLCPAFAHSVVVRKSAGVRLRFENYFFSPQPQFFNGILSTDNLVLFGAENETRTRDPNLGKVMLYQLSYFRK